MKKKISVKTLYLLGIITIGLIGLGVGSTYAMFTASAEIDNPITIYATLNNESDIIETIEVVVDAKSNKEVPITINNSSSSTLNYAVWYISSDNSIKVGTNLSKFDSNSSTSTIANNATKKVYVQLKNMTLNPIVITIGVSSNSNNVIISDTMNLVPNRELATLTETITKLYTNATKTTATVNNITYNLASSVGLMNDRLGSSSIGIDNGNIRYYGASPNNYIYFNCSDYNNQSSSTCETWRIVGVFDDKVKIIRNFFIGSYSWDTSESTVNDGYGVNDWSQADLMKILNPGYESESVGGSLYWNAKSGTCYNEQNNDTTTCDFTSSSLIGLKNDTTRNMIANTVYYLRENASLEVYTDVMYNKERKDGTVYNNHSETWTGKIAVPYASDYGYAADLSLCNQTLYDYSNSTCTANNWMKNLLTWNGNWQGWLLTPYPGNDYGFYSYFVSRYGGIVVSIVRNGSGTIEQILHLSSPINVYPTLYLNSDTMANVSIGNGTSSNPYQIVID